jgi:ubiquitin C-terminal hydrolase
MFESSEEIPEKEGLNCDSCRKPTHHTRKMGVSKAPPILVIHLKRFKIINK